MEQLVIIKEALLLEEQSQQPDAEQQQHRKKIPKVDFQVEPIPTVEPMEIKSEVDLTVGLADKATNSYFVEKIVDCTVDDTDKTKLWFLIKWVGWDSKDNTWEPQINLEDSFRLVENFFSRSRNKKIKSLYSYFKKAKHTSQTQQKKRPQRKFKSDSTDVHKQQPKRVKKSIVTMANLVEEVKDEKKKIESDEETKVEAPFYKQSEPLILEAGKSLKLFQLKDLCYCKHNGRIYPCWPDKTFEKGGIPADICGSIELRAINSTAYFVQWRESDDYRLVFHEIAMNRFPRTLEAYLQKTAESPSLVSGD